jgi:hypothetical protein
MAVRINAGQPPFTRRDTRGGSNMANSGFSPESACWHHWEQRHGLARTVPAAKANGQEKSTQAFDLGACFQS